MAAKKIIWAYKIISAKIFNKKLPFIVGWALTYRCNRNCLYCALPAKNTQELESAEIFRIMDELKLCGCEIISFTGGEPLLRDDFGEIISKAVSAGFKIRVNSNGFFVASKIEMLKKIDRLNLSLDGPREINDKIRGDGSFEAVIEASESAIKANIGLSYCCVLNALNLERLDYVLSIADKYNCGVLFQAASENILGGSIINGFAPEKQKLIHALDMLIKSKNKRILNSINSLEYMKSYPTGAPVACPSSLITCRIEPNGEVLHCSREDFNYRILNAARCGFKLAFESLPAVNCSKCFCAGRMELNEIMKFRFKSY